MKEDIEKGTLIWPQIMKQSNNWKFRHVEYLEDHFMKIKQEASAQQENDSSGDVDIEGDNKKPTWWRGHDLSFSKGNLIVVEGITEERKIILLPLFFAMR